MFQNKIFLSIVLAIIIIIFPLYSYSDEFINPQIYLRKVNTNRADGVKLNFDNSVEYYSGNVDLVKLNSGAVGRYVFKKSLALLKVRASFIESNSDTFLSSSASHLRFLQYFDPIIQCEIYSEVFFGERINVKYQVGAGIRLVPFEDDDSPLFAVGTSLLFEKIKYSDDDAYSDSGKTLDNFRFNNYIHFFTWFTKNQVGFYSTIYYQPNIEDINDYNILSEMALKVKATKILNFSIHWYTTFYKVVPESRRSLDHTILMKISFGF